MKSRLRHKREQYESLSVVVIKSIKHSDALAVWVLLMSMPPDWTIRRCWLQERLCIGRKRLANAIKKLTELQLWESVYVKGKDGKLDGKEIWIYDVFPEMRNRSPKVPLCDASDNRPITKYTSTHNVIESEGRNIKPASSGDTSKTITFALQFGVEWPNFLCSYIDEERAVKIALSYKLSPGEMRFVLAEFIGLSLSGFTKGAVPTWVWLCKAQSLNQLNLSKLGEENLPPWI